MRRAVIVASAPLDAGGGVASVCRGTAAALAAHGLTVDYLDTSGLVERSALRALPGRRLWYGTAEAVLAARRPRGGEPEVAVSNGPVGWRLRGRRRLHLYHGTYAGQALAVRPYVSRRGYAKLRHLDGMVLERRAGAGKVCLANSRQTAREVGEFFGHDCAVVWCPVDTDSFAPGPRDPALLACLGLPAGGSVGLFVGAGRPAKGARFAYAAMARLPQTAWLVVGDPSEAPPATLHGRVRMVRSVPRSSLPALYRSVDVVLAPAVYEPFGLVVAEALASGTPVVTGPTGAGELLMAAPPLDGWVVADPSDAESLAGALRAVLDEPHAARAAALEGRRRVQGALAPDVWGARFLRAGGLA